MLEALSLEGMGIVGGVITEEDLEELADAHEDIADDLSAQASVAEAFVAGLRSRVLAMDAARLGQVRLLASRLGLMQVHKDLNEHDGELRVPGLPPSSPLYHTGDGEFGFLLAWYGDELKIVRILID
jgi:hypothetical protein